MFKSILSHNFAAAQNFLSFFSPPHTIEHDSPNRANHGTNHTEDHNITYTATHTNRFVLHERRNGVHGGNTTTHLFHFHLSNNNNNNNNNRKGYFLLRFWWSFLLTAQTITLPEKKKKKKTNKLQTYTVWVWPVTWGFNCFTRQTQLLAKTLDTLLPVFKGLSAFSMNAMLHFLCTYLCSLPPTDFRWFASWQRCSRPLVPLEEVTLYNSCSLSVSLTSIAQCKHDVLSLTRSSGSCARETSVR